MHVHVRNMNSQNKNILSRHAVSMQINSFYFLFISSFSRSRSLSLSLIHIVSINLIYYLKLAKSSSFSLLEYRSRAHSPTHFALRFISLYLSLALSLCFLSPSIIISSLPLSSLAELLMLSSYLFSIFISSSLSFPHFSQTR